MTDNTRDIYTAYLQEKTDLLGAHLEKLKEGNLWSSICPSPIEGGFRNRAKFKIYKKANGILVMGTDPIQGEVPVNDGLWILPEWGRERVLEINKILMDNYLKWPADGFELKLTHGRKECFVVLSVKRGMRSGYDKLAEALINNIRGLKGVAIPSIQYELGEIYLHHRILDLEILSHYRSFFQANIHLVPKLVQSVRSSLEPNSFKRIIDLYCGVGLFSLALKDRSEEVVGVDSSLWAVKSAEVNCVHLDLHHLSFRSASVEGFLETFPLSRDDLVLLNPPRQGNSPEVIETVASQNPQNICIVSCFLETQLRDLGMWRNFGYSVRSIEAYDMFPFTDFLETVTFLES